MLCSKVFFCLPHELEQMNTETVQLHYAIYKAIIQKEEKDRKESERKSKKKGRIQAWPYNVKLTMF